MINIYPANRLENLVILLDRVMQTGANTNILDEEIILVQSKGMQHWLNLKLAESRGISMNLTFSLPMQFFWNQIRHILGKELVPEQSSYSREVLSWRIDAILASDELINNPLSEEATHYWLGQHKDKRHGDVDKRFQLSCQLADLFEQYQIFRPDWLLRWEDNSPELISERSSENSIEHLSESWQALIWNMLVSRQPLHPVRLLKQALDHLNRSHSVHLPERISLFGINTLPPLWLEFLSELGRHTQVHFFHLNPCVEYWGDLKTDKALAREQFYRWMNVPDIEQMHQSDFAEIPVSNPLLANLGGQGKDFLYLLQEHTSIEIPVYESPLLQTSDGLKNSTVLKKIQNDILNLSDARQTPEIYIDDSVFIVSAHSALREIQALHDWLLHQINNDSTLTPKDILVMCPNVENYAPYVEAVFAHGWSDWSERIPPLPCSIADRILKDSEPLVQAFIEFLELPDSRFQISQILSYLRLPAVQHKFSYDEADLVIMERWFNHAAIHWGLDAQHKQQILAVEHSNNKFTWQQGLNRLLLGFAQGDQEALYQEQLLLPDVEGDEALLLGRCIELLEQLQFYARELQSARRPEQWQQFLHQARENLFANLSEDSNAQQIIEQAIDDLGEYTAQAQYDELIALSVVRDFLLNHFSQPEPGRQFMAGQVTFSSMIPMRSVPFRVIAILGLNDGEFPRQRQPMGFDLMAAEPARKGDRSRRGDDRYLFLEALISCRDKLYLSYQGHDIKTNNTREPSLVLQELMNYLEKGYGWQLSGQNRMQLYQVPMQAFSVANYQRSADAQRQLQSFNEQWLNLSKAGESRNNLQAIEALNANDDEVKKINAEDLVRFFDNPCRSFAQTRLKLFLETRQEFMTEDCEPFVSNHLDRYVIQDEIIQTFLSENSDEQAIEHLMQGFRISGRLPDTPDAENELKQWQLQACDYAQHVQDLCQSQGQITIQIISVTVTIDGIDIEADLPVLNDQLLFWRLATPKGKDDIRLWIYHLIAQIISNQSSIDKNKLSDNDFFDNKPIHTTGIFRGKDDSISSVSIVPVEQAHQQLSQLLRCWKEGMQRPLLINAELGKKHCQGKQNQKPMTDIDFYNFWMDDYQKQGLGSDPYVYWFWGDTQPKWQGELMEQIEALYCVLYEHRQEESNP